jgi:predicted O-linked N-acetylglucosamine transferase (SPINDLY family)
MSDWTVQQRFDMALQLHQAGHVSEAESAYRQVLAQDPQHADALHNMGIIAYSVGKNDAAEKLLRLVIRLQPAHAEAYSNLSNVLRDEMRYEEAIEASKKSIFYKNDSSGAYFNLGLNLHARHHHDEAEQAFRQAIALDPNMYQAYSSLAAVLADKGDLPNAIDAYRQSLVLNPHFLDAHNNLGNVLMSCGLWEEALASFQAAIDIDPTDAYALCNMANAKGDIFLLDEAIELYRKALECMPEKYEIRSSMLLSFNYHCNLSAQEIFQEHRLWQTMHADSFRDRVTQHTSRRQPGKRLRVGFMSPDFRRHSVAYFLMPLLEHLDRSQFEIVCYSDVQNPDDFTQHFEALSHQWRNIAAATMQEVVDLVRNDAIDILIDLAGHTAYNRMVVFAHKPAPIQISWLGYPNTSGLVAMDYRITDAIADPLGETEHLHTERFIRLPVSAWCYRALEVSPAVAPLPSLTNGYVTFGSFNAMIKINKELLSLWAEILHKVPESRLYLKNKAIAFPQLQELVNTFFAERGISKHRIIVSPQTQKVCEHLEQYARVDISLDTLPYHGTTTTCEALWMGVPVVTVAGRVHNSRVGASLLNQIGHPEWIAQNREQYVAIACSLAADLTQLSQMRQQLRETMRTSPLMDEVRFTRDMEAALREAWCADATDHSS